MKKANLVLVFLLLLLGSSSIVAWAQHQYWRLPDGTPVEANNQVACLESHHSSTDSSDFCYLEPANRSSAIKVESYGYIYEGDLVDVYGVMGTAADGSRKIILTGGQPLDYGYPWPRPLGISPESLKFAPELLMRTWGTVTEVDSAAYPVSNWYVINGAVKVYDNVNPSPAVGDFKTVTGMHTREIDSAGNKTQDLYACYPGYDFNNTRGPGSYTLTGQIFVDYFAEGQTVQIATDYGQTTCELDWLGYGEYSMTLPAGYYTVSAEVPGYSTCTTFADLTANDAEADFGWFSPLPVSVLAPLATRVSAGGAMTLKGWLYDAEACGMPNSEVPWSTDDGQRGLAITDSQGDFSLELNTPARKVMTVSFGSAGSAFVQVADPSDPTCMIQSPLNNATLAGFATLSVNFVPGSNGITSKKLLVDGNYFCSFFGDADDKENQTTINTAKLSNGKHTLVAVVTDTRGIVTQSNVVTIIAKNDFSNLTSSSSELFTDDQSVKTVTFSGVANQAWTWTLTNVETGYCITSVSGDAGPATLTWNGKYTYSGGGYVPGGIYKAALWYPGQTNYDSTGNSILSNEQYCAVSQGAGAAGQMLCMGKAANETPDMADNVIQEMITVYDACQARGLKCTLLLDPVWSDPQGPGDFGWPNKRGMNYWLGVEKPKDLFFASHGSPVLSSDGKLHTFFDFADGVSVSYCNDWVPRTWTDPVTGKVHTFTQQQIDTTNPAFTMYTGSWCMNLVEFNCCFSAGSWTDGMTEYNEYTKAFAIDPCLGCGVFIGWDGAYRPFAVPILWALSPNGWGWTVGFWHFLGEGYTVNQAECLQALNLDPSTWGWMDLLVAIQPDENSWATYLE